MNATVSTQSHTPPLVARLLAAVGICLTFSTLPASATAQGLEPQEEMSSWQSFGPLTNLSAAPPHSVEIAHAIVLPPPAGAPDTVRVLFFTRQFEASNCQSATFGKSWIWKPSRSMTIAQFLPMPSTAASDPFCSGHTHLPDGDVVVVGGLDYAKKCNGALCEHGKSVGHTATWRLDVSVDPPQWSAAPTMANALWYPTAIATHDGVFVAGHGEEAEPGFSCDTLLNPKNFQRYQRWDASPTGSFQSWSNYKHFDTDPQCSALNLVSVGDYPRLHLLASGEVMMSNAFRTMFLDLKNPPPCTAIGPRWESEPVSQTGFWPRRGGNSVHLVYRDALGVRHEVVYNLGGTTGHDDDTCQADGSGAIVTNHVEKMTDPGPSKAWVDAPPLNHARYNHEVRFLLDGSLIVTGGNYWE